MLRESRKFNDPYKPYLTNRNDNANSLFYNYGFKKKENNIYQANLFKKYRMKNHGLLLPEINSDKKKTEINNDGMDNHGYNN